MNKVVEKIDKSVSPQPRALKIGVSLLDNLRPFYGTPSHYLNANEAIRDFRYTCNNVPQVKSFPEHYSIVHIYDFDEECGKVIPVEPTILARATDFVHEPEILDTLKLAIKELVLEHKEIVERSRG